MTSDNISLIARSNPLNLAKIAVARILGRDATVTSDGIKLVIGTHRGEGAVCALQGRQYEEIERFLAVANEAIDPASVMPSSRIWPSLDSL